MLSFRLWIVTLFFLWAIPGNVWSTTLLKLSFEDLVRTSPVIVRAEALGNETTTDAATGRSHILTTFKVLETLRGTVGETLTVRQLSGFGKTHSMKLPGNTTFSIGDEVVLFLFQRSEEGQVYFLRGMTQGRFQVNQDPDSGKKLVRRSLNNVRLMQWNLKKSAAETEADEPQTLDVFRKKIERVLQSDGSSAQ